MAQMHVIPSPNAQQKQMMSTHGRSMMLNEYNRSNYSEYSMYNLTLPGQQRVFQIGRYIETSDSSDSDDDMDLMPPINDPFYRN